VRWFQLRCRSIPVANARRQLSLRYVNLCSVLTSQDRREARSPNIRDFTTHINSSVFLETHRGSLLATGEIEYESLRVLRPGALP
jgi:hypothetical protein